MPGFLADLTSLRLPQVMMRRTIQAELGITRESNCLREADYAAKRGAASLAATRKYTAISGMTGSGRTETKGLILNKIYLIGGRRPLYELRCYSMVGWCICNYPYAVAYRHGSNHVFSLTVDMDQTVSNQPQSLLP